MQTLHISEVHCPWTACTCDSSDTCWLYVRSEARALEASVAADAALYKRERERFNRGYEVPSIVRKRWLAADLGQQICAEEHALARVVLWLRQRQHDAEHRNRQGGGGGGGSGRLWDLGWDVRQLVSLGLPGWPTCSAHLHYMEKELPLCEDDPASFGGLASASNFDPVRCFYLCAHSPSDSVLKWMLACSMCCAASARSSGTC